MGVHEITPLLELIVIPLGAETRLNVKMFVGMSLSVAVFVTVNVVSSSKV